MSDIVYFKNACGRQRKPYGFEQAGHLSRARHGSEQALEQLPATLRQFAAFERFHLHRVDEFQQPMRDPDFDQRFLPQNCDAFELPCYWVARKHLYRYGSASQTAFTQQFLGAEAPDERVLFPVHPTGRGRYDAFMECVGAEDARHTGTRIWAVPMSSTRTVLAWPDGEPHKAIFLKLTLHSPIFGDRHLYRKTVACSIGLSRLIALSSQDLPASFDSFPEPIGFIPRRLPDCGFIARQIPPALLTGAELAVPLFALFGGLDGRRPLLPQLLEAAKLSLRDFVEQILCVGFAKLWLRMWLELGLILEAHAQDLLLCVTPELAPCARFYYRDFEGLQVDWALRSRRALREPVALPHAWQWFDTYDTWGHRGYQLVSTKIRTSLFDYMYFVLEEVPAAARDGRLAGPLRGRALAEGEPVSLLAGALRVEARERFGERLAGGDDILRNLHRFVADLMSLRKAVLR